MVVGQLLISSKNDLIMIMMRYLACAEPLRCASLSVAAETIVLNFGAPNDISGSAEARVVNFCRQVDYIKS